jgi:signal transduction histidine kinase
VNTVTARVTEKDLAQVAHDLRTPLSAVLMWVRLLRSGAAPDPEVALAAIEKSAVELSRTIDGLDRPRRARKGARSG